MAMQLEKSQWRAYFDRMSKALVGKRAEIEVASLKLGDRIEAEGTRQIILLRDPLMLPRPAQSTAKAG
jgi:hypothetical protein